jgi:TolB-like protein
MACAPAGSRPGSTRSELRGGDAWDANIRRQIRDCALFVPMISASTESRSEGYFRLEWHMAVERSFHFAEDRSFLMPVVIDGTAQASARVPQRFRERQWTSLPGGTPTPQFITHVRELLAGAAVSAGTAGVAATQPPGRGHRRFLITALVAGVLLAALVLGWLHRSAVSGTSAAVASASDRKSIAVLPFENLTGHADDAYLADGLQEEILNALALIRDFKVISRTSVAEYRGVGRNMREIGSRLGVGTVLEGSVRREANTLRLTIQLISANDDVHLLATNYDREIGQILGLQSEVAREVAEALSATLSRAERGELDHLGTNNGDAYRSYLKAVALLRPWGMDDDVTEPARLLEEAIRLDPEFADAYALQSRMYSLLYMHSERAEDGAHARAAFERALAIDPGLVEARLARGLYELYVAKDLDRALADLEAVASLRPSSPSALQALALVLRRRGRMSESLTSFQRAWDLDPLNHIYDLGVLTTCVGLRRFPESLEWARLHQVRFPDNPFPQVVRADIQWLTASNLEPLQSLLQRTDFDPDMHRSIEARIATAEGRYRDAIALWESRTDIDAHERLEGVAFLYRAQGDAAAAEQRFRALERELAATLRTPAPDRDDLLKSLALVQSVLGEHEAALRTIEEARARVPESRDHVNGPAVSFVRSVVLARAGRTAEAYAEVERLLHVPFGSPVNVFPDLPPVYLLLQDDAHFDELIHRPPRL